MSDMKHNKHSMIILSDIKHVVSISYSWGAQSVSGPSGDGTGRAGKRASERDNWGHH